MKAKGKPGLETVMLPEVHWKDVMYDNGPPDLTEEQLLLLLDECERTESAAQDMETNDTTP
ncbi:hypothetical protein EYF80_002468 [Liparis tanakae]|uniref:Uncharacterized protein n=1 Tax=Liparis tanakae TaxID=230148 RepID=A0A4Z2JAS3_9TELE|nr:hypothetical protein EYF80_002468 [Liparis tanakae]